jgi:hypothetical protein
MPFPLVLYIMGSVWFRAAWTPPRPERKEVDR